jgi:hypothetical protein
MKSFAKFKSECIDNANKVIEESNLTDISVFAIIQSLTDEEKLVLENAGISCKMRRFFFSRFYQLVCKYESGIAGSLFNVEDDLKTKLYFDIHVVGQKLVFYPKFRLKSYFDRSDTIGDVLSTILEKRYQLEKIEFVAPDKIVRMPVLFDLYLSYERQSWYCFQGELVHALPPIIHKLKRLSGQKNRRVHGRRKKKIFITR